MADTTAATRRKRGMKVVLAAKPDVPAMPWTPQLAQHHDLEAPGRTSAVHRIVTRLDKLRDEGSIDNAEWQAGCDYRRDVELGEMGGTLGEMGGPGGGSGCPTQARLDALRRLANARLALTASQRAAMDAVAADASWIDLGRALYPSDLVSDVILRRWGAKLAIQALGVLAHHYRLYGTGARMRSVEVGRAGV